MSRACLLLALAACTACKINVGRIPCESTAQCPIGETCDLDGFCSTETSCGSNHVVCSGVCTDATTSQNCGACGNVCTSAQVCTNGACAEICLSGLSVCASDGGTVCRDLQSDPANCGICGKACGDGEVCAAGSCAPACDAPLTACGADGGSAAFCADTRTDSANCGSCGKACDATEVCASGSCAPACDAPLTKCSEPDGGALFCADTRTDAANCGTCGHACDNGEVCSGGGCAAACNAPLTTCTDTTTGALYCADTNTSPSDCGTCGHACDNGEVCSGGVCAAACNAPLTTCTDTTTGALYCADTRTDPNNCGACGAPAAEGQDGPGSICFSNQTCVSGICTDQCPFPLAACAPSDAPADAGTVCIDLLNDPHNCGGCLGQGGVDCTLAGERCSEGACVAGCSSPLTVCGTADGGQTCIDTNYDPQNCGGCGAVAGNSSFICAAGQTCASGACASICGALSYCPPVNVDGGASCADFENDPDNCGGCGNVCPLNETCQKGTCGYGDQQDAYITPGYPYGSASRPRATEYQIATPGASTLLYSLDGGIPLDGGSLYDPNGQLLPGITAADSPLALTLDSQTVSWLAVYDDGHTDPVHSFTHVTTGFDDNRGQIIEGVSFDGELLSGAGGPAVNVSPGASLEGSLNYEWWRADANGYCDGCVQVFMISFVDQVSNPVLYCDVDSAGESFSGAISGSLKFNITAPTTPGVYAIRAGIALDYQCYSSFNSGGEDLGIVVVSADNVSVSNASPSARAAPHSSPLPLENR